MRDEHGFPQKKLHGNEVWLKLEIQNGHQETVWAWKRCTFVFALDCTNMDGFFWNLECRLV